MAVITLEATKLLLDNIYSDSSSSDEEENELIDIYMERLKQRIQEKNIPSRIKLFIDVTISNSTDKEFQSHFRITRNTFQQLIQKIGPLLQKSYGKGRDRINIEKQILSSLWILANPDSYRSVGNRFDMGKSSLFWCFVRFINALNKIAPDIVKWPSRAEVVAIKEKYKSLAGINGVLGAIDGTYVPIRAPKENPQQYVNRKCFYGITLQAISIPNLQFIDCFTGYPSSVSDIRIFRNSPIYNEFINNNNVYFSQDEFIIGDKAYPLHSWCLPPYIDRGNLDNMRIHFNHAHASTRQVVERSFALLFGRFRRLRYLDMKRLDLIPKTIIACCVLHNICLMTDDLQLSDYLNEGVNIVQQNERNNEINGEDRDGRQIEGNNLRDRISRIIYEQYINNL